tara:strand:+ start:7306 stop:7428 length:123 start_codon:yes stop_codon:yes gene_type:complete
MVEYRFQTLLLRSLCDDDQSGELWDVDLEFFENTPNIIEE